MAYPFGTLVFTPAIKALQEKYGSRRQYANREASSISQEGLGPDEAEFLAECDSFYMASVGESGWPYVQHRGGPKGFLKIIDKSTVAFADFRGNKQYVSTGNLMKDDRVALILVDYPRQARLKILGHVKILEGAEAKAWVERLRDPDYHTAIERVYVIQVEAFDWNCQQHITQRFTEDQVRESLVPIEKQMQALKEENDRLKSELAQLRGRAAQ